MADIKTARTVQGDLWDSVAERELGDCLLAGLLMDANPSFLHVYRFQAGVELVIPVLPEASETADENRLPPWKRGNT